MLNTANFLKTNFTLDGYMVWNPNLCKSIHKAEYHPVKSAVRFICLSIKQPEYFSMQENSIKIRFEQIYVYNTASFTAHEKSTILVFYMLHDFTY